MKNNKWTTSENGEIFNGEEYETREECIREEVKERMTKPFPGKGFWIGEMIECFTHEFIDCEDILENALCRAEDVVGESGEDYLVHVTAEEKLELNQLIVNFLDSKGYKPGFYKIRNSEFIELPKVNDESDGVA